jgi:membrane-associated PAP2 superfamily phosphatase
MMQGAHFLSHNLWTLLFDWTICLLCYRWVLYRAPLPQHAEQPVLKPLEG